MISRVLYRLVSLMRLVSKIHQFDAFDLRIPYYRLLLRYGPEGPLPSRVRGL